MALKVNMNILLLFYLTVYCTDSFLMLTDIHSVFPALSSLDMILGSWRAVHYYYLKYNFLLF